MAKKGTTKIELEMYAALEKLMGSTIQGTFYPSDLRPLDASTEDAVLTVSNATATQIQEGRARLNIYVPDIDNGGATLVPDKARLMELEELTDKVVETLNEADTTYIFDLFQATATIAVPGKNEHFLNIGIHFKLANF
jgi:hypothetical protein